jgi:hypothetical protein
MSTRASLNEKQKMSNFSRAAPEPASDGPEFFRRINRWPARIGSKQVLCRAQPTPDNVPFVSIEPWNCVIRRRKRASTTLERERHSAPHVAQTNHTNRLDIFGSKSL